MCTHEWTVAGRWHDVVPACESPLQLVCIRCQEARGVRCGSSRASKCQPCADTYRQRVAVVAGSGAEVMGVRGLFITLTAPGAAAHYHQDGRRCRCTPEGGVDLATWNVSAVARFNNFIRDLSREMGADIVFDDEAGKRIRIRGLSYFKAAEVQRRGALHFHVMVKRIDGTPAKLSVQLLRKLAVKHGFGHSVDVQRLEPGHAAYVAKYVSKASDQRVDVPWSGVSYQKPVNPHHVVRRVSALIMDEVTGAVLGQAGSAYLALFLAPGLVLVPFRPVRTGGMVVDTRTGLVVGAPLVALVSTASYRTWTKARSWGRSMADVRAAQQHYVLTVLALPAWSERPGARGWSCLPVPVRPDGAPPAPPE